MFTAYMQDDQPLKPANILNIVATNQGRRPLTKHYPQASPLTTTQVQQHLTEGHVILDTRSSAEFGSGHIPGAINVQLTSGEFEQRAGWMTPDDTPIILVTDQDEDAQTAIYKMAFIALNTQVTGYLQGGVTAWMDAGQSLATVPQMDVHTLKHKLMVNGLQVLDVRDQEEWDEGHIEQAHFSPYTRLVPQITGPALIDALNLNQEQNIAITCATGKRSSTAISILLRAGYKHLYNVTGGMEAWKSAHFPMLDGEGALCKL